ncbi:MAG: FAD-binding oxidoreductase [Acidocella sp.]|nr:FAD-binding oxidoreductase [Acidocella sp.]
MLDLINQLRAALGDKAVLANTPETAPFETDWRRIYHNKSVCVVLPETTAQVAAAIRIAAAAGVKLVPQGGNTGLVAGAVPTAGPPQIVMNLQRMNKIRTIDATGDTITVDAGVTLQAVQEAAARSGRLFPVSLAAEGSVQIGGAISTNAGGIQVLAYGSMRAQVLGLEVVLADGRVWDGLRLLRKDNTGFDLKQIFIGGEGLLGIITAAVLRLHPAVTAHATALVGVPNIYAAVALFKALQVQAGQSVSACEFITAGALALGLAHSPAIRLPFTAANYVLVEISAHAPGQGVQEILLSVLEPLLESGIASDVVVAQSERERADLWRMRETLSDGELAAGGSIKHDISVPISDIPVMVAAVETLVAQRFPGFRLNIFGHLGDGNLHLNVRPPAGRTLADIGASKAAITEAVERLAMDYAGSFSAEHGIGQMRLEGMAAHKSSVELDLMRALKTALDPQGLLNPGKMLPEP